MKIAILGEPLDQQRAGIHVFTREMVKALIKNNNDHELILVRESEKNAIEGIRQLIVPRFPFFAAYRKFFEVPKKLNNLNIDLVLEPAQSGPLNLKRSIKRVTCIHDLTPVIYPHLHKFGSSFRQKLFLPRILKRTDLIIANSDNTARDLQRVYPFTKNKVRRLYPGKSGSYSPDTDTTALNKLNIDAAYFLCVGTIEPRKNHLQLLRAFRLFKENSQSDAKLVVIGERGWKFSDFDAELSRHPFKNDIVCPGYIDGEHLPALYTNAIASIYPSSYEGFGFPVLESMSCGTRVIIPRNSSLPEVGGEIADYYEEENDKSLSDKMSELFEYRDSGSEIESKLLKWSGKFSWEKFAAEFYKTIEDI